MKLNHDIYREAMENVRISDETGKELLELAAQQNAQHKKKFKTQMAAAIAAILAISLGVNGICYAQTGKNVLEMFAGLYENIASGTPSKSFDSMIDGAQESGKSFTCGNFKFTLEYYIYDQKHGEAYMALRTESLDKAPIDMEKINEHYSAYINGGAGGGCNYSDPVYNKEGNAAVVYYHELLGLEESMDFPKKLAVGISHVVCDDNQELEQDKSYETEDFDFAEITPTGEMKARYVDCSSLEHCSSKARITGGGFVLLFDDTFEIKESYTFPLVEIEMADGTIYRFGSVKGRGLSQKMPLYDANGKLQNEDDFTPEEIELLGTYKITEDVINPLPENIKEIAGGYGFGNNVGGCPEYSAVFHDFVNVDDIVSVRIDHVKMRLE